MYPMGLFDKISGLFSRSPRHARDFDNSSTLQEAPSGWALPPLSSREAQAVLTESEYAALEATPDDGDRLNPHPPGSREHRLWAENFAAVQSALRKKR
jgi:hypothetical protein